MPRSLTATLRACLDGTRRENFPPINPWWWWWWWTRISSLSRIVVLGFVPRHAHNSPIGDRFLFRLPAFDENRSGRERHSAKKFLSDDLHVEANDRKSRFMSFTLMLTLWPLTYHFFPHRWKLRRACIQPHASWRCHDARGRDTINRENSSENRLIIGQPRERKLSRAIEFFYFSNKIRKFIDLISIQSFARILIWIYIYIYIFRSNCLSWKL